MKKQLLFVLLYVCGCCAPAFCQLPKWTILVYMNADNDLERFGIRDFLEMAKVDDSKDVNILVQMDRTPGYTAEYGDWTQTLRFKVAKNMVPSKEQSLQDLGEKNMGDPNTLKDFIDWGKQNYPAENYALIIWDHGDGWRYNEASAEMVPNKLKNLYFQDYQDALAANEKTKNEVALQKLDFWTAELSEYRSELQKLTKDLNKTAPKITGLPPSLKETLSAESDFSDLYRSFKDFVSKSLGKIPSNQLSLIDKYTNTLDNILSNNMSIKNLERKIESAKNNDLIVRAPSVDNLRFGTLETNPVKAVSHDGSDGDVLYNKEIHDILPDTVVSVIGFDACLMSMLETGYTLRNKAGYLIGSEELEPGDGWNYTLWLGDLVINPRMSPLELAKNIVQNFGKTYQYQNEVTLSAVDLSLMQKLAGLISDLSTRMMGNMATERNNIWGARERCQKYATSYASIHSIDLSLFLYQLAATTANNDVKNLCSQVRSLINLLVVANYFSDDRNFLPSSVSYGSFGIAIYFPKRKDYFDAAYTEGNKAYPVEFVLDNKWDNFLQAYFN